MSIPPGGFSIPEFRSEHGYSEATHNSLKKANLAPKETMLPNSKYSRILPADYEAWLKLISAPDCQLKEFLRRHEQYSAQGRKAAQSTGHPAQIWATFKKMRLTKEKPAPKRRGRPASPVKRPTKQHSAEAVE
jgi:hypothetical protein